MKYGGVGIESEGAVGAAGGTLSVGAPTFYFFRATVWAGWGVAGFSKVGSRDIHDVVAFVAVEVVIFTAHKCVVTERFGEHLEAAVFAAE